MKKKGNGEYYYQLTTILTNFERKVMVYMPYLQVVS